MYLITLKRLALKASYLKSFNVHLRESDRIIGVSKYRVLPAVFKNAPEGVKESNPKPHVSVIVK